jgi:hypothetical protein
VLPWQPGSFAFFTRSLGGPGCIRPIMMSVICSGSRLQLFILIGLSINSNVVSVVCLHSWSMIGDIA